MRFTQDFIERVRESNNVVDVLSQFTQLKPVSGGRLMGLCPFPGHSEKTPSFSVSEEKQVYHCFGCKASGNIYTAVQTLQGLSFPEAVEYLAQKAQISPTEKDYEKGFFRKKGKASSSSGSSLLKLTEAAERFFHRELKKSSEASGVKRYCASRGLSLDVIDKFCLGWAPSGWEGLSRHLVSQGFSLEEAKKLGLVRPRSEDKGGGHYDLFRARLMFPIFSLKGSCVGFGGRVLSSDESGGPKYINSSESEVFTKGGTLYGLNETAKYLRSFDEAIVVEGYMDFLSLYAAGFTNVVATLGTALTPQHARLIKRFTRRVVILFDGDAAGQKAGQRSLSVLLKEGLLPRGLSLPDDQDPDDFLSSHGAEALREQLKKAPELFMSFLDRQMDGYRGTSLEKVSVMEKLVPVLGCVGEPRLRELYLEEVALRLEVSSNWILRFLRQGVSERGPSSVRSSGSVAKGSSPSDGPGDLLGSSAEVERERIDLLGASRAELFLLNLSLMQEPFFEKALDPHFMECLQHEGLRKVLERARDIHRQEGCPFDKLTARLMDEVKPATVLGFQEGPELSQMGLEEQEKMFYDCQKRVQERHVRVKTKGLLKRLERSGPSDKGRQLEQIMNMHRDRHRLNRSE